MLMAPNPANMMIQLGWIATVVQTMSIMVGLGLMLGGLFLLKKYGETRTFMSHQMTLAGPVMMMFGGVMFLVLPTVIQSSTYAFWGHWSPEHYSSSISGIDQYVPVVLMFVRLVGVTTIMRGLILFSRMGGHGAQPGTLGKAMLHLFGGILCVHILWTVDLLKKILDIAS